MSPLVGGESPADLHHPRLHVVGGPQSDVADAGRSTDHLDAPQAPAVRRPAFVDPAEEVVGPLGRLRTLEELRDDRVGVDGRERRAVVRFEAPHRRAVVLIVIGPTARSLRLAQRGSSAATLGTEFRSVTGSGTTGQTPEGADMLERPSKAFDADNHYYEAEDAFIRHVDPEDARRGACDGPRSTASSACSSAARSTASSPTRRSIRAPSPVRSIDYFRGKVGDHRPRRGVRRARPDQPGVPRPAARVKVMDEQGLDGAFLFPTLGVGMESVADADRPALLAAFRGFNRWLLDDWTYDYQGRLYAAPYLTLVRPGVGGRGARVRAGRTARGSSTCGPDRSRIPPGTDRSGTRPTIRSGRGSTRPASPSRSTPATRATASCSSSGASTPSSRPSGSPRCSSCSRCRRSATPSPR